MIQIILIVVLYVVLIILIMSRTAAALKNEEDDKLRIIEVQYEELLEKADRLTSYKLSLENETIKIFTLYELTKEITKSLKRDKAFEIFRERLREYVLYDECVFLEPLSGEYKKIKNAEDYYVFTLKGKRKKIGYLGIKGAQDEDYENINVLGHQFALALRRIDLYEELERIAITDSLTELNTRRYTLEQLQEEMSRSKMRKISLSFLMIDVDYFKKYNDQYGHLTGDKILHEIGVIIKDNIREIDIAGRYGGEEFCVILPDTDVKGAQYAAERIKKAAGKAVIKVYDASVKITLSIGVCTFPDHAQEINELIDKSDWALYRAKKQGRNRICAFGKYSKD